MTSIKLNDGKSIPALGWGNGTGGIERSGQKAIDLGAFALKAGILHIDTAQIYGTEAETQGAIDKAGMTRGDVWVTSKISGDCKTTAESIRSSIKGSLDKLTSPPDLLLIHSPFVPEDGKIGEFWTILEGLVEDGTLKGTSLGVSNFRPQDLNDVLKVAKIKPVVNQMEYHPYLLTHIQPVLDLQEKHGIVTQAYGPLSPILRHPGGPLKPVLSKIAQRLGTDEANVLLKWTIQNGVVAITTSSNEGRIEKMAQAYKLDKLTDAEMAEIDKVGRGVHFRSYAGHMSKDFPAPNLPDGNTKTIKEAPHDTRYRDLGVSVLNPIQRYLYPWHSTQMWSSNKRPTTSKPFNPSTTHPASIPSMSGNTTQKKEHVTKSDTGGRQGTNPTDAELGQSGGGGGGGTGAGSMGGTGDEKELDSLARQSSGKGLDSSKVHPGSVSSGDKGKQRDSKL